MKIRYIIKQQNNKKNKSRNKNKKYIQNINNNNKLNVKAMRKNSP